jgi:cell division septation protein DedD
MGKASSSKKVARAAGLGGSRAYSARPAWGYYFAIALLVVLGLVGVYNSRELLDAKTNQNGAGKPAVHQSPPWFEGFAVDACGKLLPPIKTSPNPNGLYTKGDGVIYISPKTKASAGKNATLGRFASSIGMTLNAGALEVPGGHLYTNGDSCEGKPGHVYVMTWSSPAAPASDGVLQNKDETSSTSGLEDTCNPDCDGGVLLENDQLVTVAFLPAPPKHQSLSVLQPPPSVIGKLTDLISTGGTTTTSTPIATTPTTQKGATTTAAVSSSSTTGKSKSNTSTATSTGTTTTGTTTPGTGTPGTGTPGTGTTTATTKATTKTTKATTST